MSRSRIVALAVALVTTAACGSNGEPVEDPTPHGDAAPRDDARNPPGRDAGEPTTRDGGGTSERDASTPRPDGAPTPTPTAMGLCAQSPPPGAERPAPVPTYSGGACPTLAPGRNTIPSGGAGRQFVLVTPTGYTGDEPLPLVFLWHWLGGDAQSFVDEARAQQAADEKGIIIVSMESKGDGGDGIVPIDFKWPYTSTDSEARIEEELTFADDVLACVAEQFTVNTDCVSHVGVSAGALWLGQLVPRRSEHVASFISLSGGVDVDIYSGMGVRPWVGGAAHQPPGFVLWGGPRDECRGFGVSLLNFQQASQNLESALTRDGHFVLECVHDCEHSVPPFEPPSGETQFAALWDFVLDHPYWLEPGASPYASDGLPPSIPGWCAIGAGSATMRSGTCSEENQCEL